MTWKIQCSGSILDNKALESMHATALNLLAQVGMEMRHEQILNELKGRKGFDIAGNRVRIAADKVEAWRKAHGADPSGPRAAKIKTLKERLFGPAFALLGGAPYRSIAPSPAGFRFTVPDRAMHILDRDGKTIRPMTRADVIACTKLVTAMGTHGVQSHAAGMPADVPAAFQPIEQYMIAAEYSPGGGSTSQVTDIRTAGFIREMNRVYERPFGLAVSLVSPLIFAGTELDILLHFRNEVELACVNSIPIMGLTGPCDPVSLYTLCVAECLGGAAILHELFPQVFVFIAPNPELTDLRTGNILAGSPEADLISLIGRDVQRFYDNPVSSRTLLTTAPLPGPRAIRDHTCSAMLGVLTGCRHFIFAGYLSLDEIFSPAMLVLDLDILGHAGRIAQGVSFGEGLDFAGLPNIVQDALHDEMPFAMHETTIRNMRQQYYQPLAMQPMSYNQWESAGRPDNVDVREAQAEADRLAANYNYEPPKDILADLRRIYNRAKAELG